MSSFDLKHTIAVLVWQKKVIIKAFFEAFSNHDRNVYLKHLTEINEIIDKITQK